MPKRREYVRLLSNLFDINKAKDVWFLWNNFIFFAKNKKSRAIRCKTGKNKEKLGSFTQVVEKFFLCKNREANVCKNREIVEK